MDFIVVFCSSDEELKDLKVLLYLFIVFEVEDFEENSYGFLSDAVLSFLMDEGVSLEKKR